MHMPHRNGTPPTSRGHRALIVDDEASIRLFYRYVLEAEGVACDEAAHGGAGLELARQHPYDLVLLDVDMPDLSGGEVCRQLRAQPPSPHLKIIMCSGRADGD